jgi:hypothetical protein
VRRVSGYWENRGMRGRMVVAAVVILVVVVGSAAALLVSGSGTPRPADADTAASPSSPAMAPPTTTPAAGPAPTTASAAPRPGAPTEWRLGYAGLGPVGLGMTFDEASRAAGVAVTPNATCGGAGHVAGLPDVYVLHRENRIIKIGVKDPTVLTISGAHIGTSEAELLAIYPHAVPALGDHGVPVLRITGPTGALINFYISANSVSGMALAGNDKDARELADCD